MYLSGFRRIVTSFFVEYSIIDSWRRSSLLGGPAAGDSSILWLFLVSYDKDCDEDCDKD